MTTPHYGFGLTEEQAAKRRRYEEALDRFAGFEPGESQLSDEEIMARRAARQRDMNPSPERTTALAGHVGQTLPFEAVVNQLLLRPGMVEHLEGIDLDGDGSPDIPLPPPPMEPMARIQWQTLASERQQRLERSERRRMQRRQINNQVLVAHLQAHDPLFRHILRWIETFLESMPARLGRAVTEQIDRTPGAFLELYSELRRHFVSAFALHGGMRDFGGGATMQGDFGVPGAFTQPHNSLRPVVADRMTAPVLESAGADEARAASASRAAEKAALVKRVKAGGAKEGDLLKYLELCGV